MRVPIAVPVDYTLDNFQIIEWHKQVGDQIHVGDELCTVETQKSTEPLIALVGGILKEIKVPADKVVSKAESEDPDHWNVVCYIETDDG